MKTRHLLLTLLAVALSLPACQRPEKDLSIPSIEINQLTASVDMPASSFSMMVLTNRAWKATADVPWIAIDPDSGSGAANGQPVTITVMENTSFTRSGHVTFDIVYDTATLTVDQAGNGSPEDYIIFYNDFDKEVATQAYGSGGTSWPYLDQFDGWKNETGVGIAAMAYDFTNVSARNNSNSNGSYSDYDGSGLNNLLFGANGHIAVKNLSLKDFKKFRLSFGTEKYDNNDKTALFDPAEMPVYLSADGEKWVPLSYTYLGTAAGRWNVAEAIFSVPDDVTTLSVYVKATIASAYRLDDLKVEVSEEAGPVIDFSSGTDLPSGGGGGGGGDTPSGASGSGTLADPYNPAGAINAVKDLTWTSNTEYQKTEKVYVKGKISKIANNGTFAQSGTFGNASFYISEDGSESGEFYVFRTMYFNGEKYTSGTDIKVGDEVIIYGALMNYKGNTPETVANECQIYSINGETGPGGGGGGGTTPSGEFGSGTLADPYTPVGAANAVKDLTWTSNTEYQKTEKVYVKGKISKIANNGTFTQGGTYGNASFYISADGSEKDEFYVFRTLYFNGEKYTSGTDIKVGDEVILYGALMNYKGNTPETVAGESNLYSLNGATSGEGGSTPSGDGSGTLADPYTPVGAANAVKDLTWTSNTEYQKTEKVYVKGKISKIANNGTFTQGGTYGNASFYISADGSEKDEFYVFRTLYFNGEKYTSGTDIKVGDEVIIYGALMNYKGNTPETVAGESNLYSLNGATSGEGGSGGGGGGDTPSGSSLSFATNSDAQTWAADTDGTYGSGYATTTQGLKIAYYKHTSSSNPVAPNANHIRVYKNSALSIGSTEGKKIKKIVIGCAPDAGTTSYCFDMTGLEGGASATADKAALTVTWTGSATKVVLHANNGQVRMEKITVEFE